MTEGFIEGIEALCRCVGIYRDEGEDVGKEDEEGEEDGEDEEGEEVK